jgi:hypothetical protein
LATGIYLLFIQALEDGLAMPVKPFLFVGRIVISLGGGGSFGFSSTKF